MITIKSKTLVNTNAIISPVEPLPGIYPFDPLPGLYEPIEPIEPLPGIYPVDPIF